MKIEYDDQILDVIDKVNKELETYGLTFEMSDDEVEGIVDYKLVKTPLFKFDNFASFVETPPIEWVITKCSHKKPAGGCGGCWVCNKCDSFGCDNLAFMGGKDTYRVERCKHDKSDE